jgi:hypothetical protein
VVAKPALAVQRAAVAAAVVTVKAATKSRVIPFNRAVAR